VSSFKKKSASSVDTAAYATNMGTDSTARAHDVFEALTGDDTDEFHNCQICYAVTRFEDRAEFNWDYVSGERLRLWRCRRCGKNRWIVDL
jgi:hypothetical protein